MTADYPTGFVGVATVRGFKNVQVVRSQRNGWFSATVVGPDGYNYHPADRVTDVRPLVVLDAPADDLTRVAQLLRDQWGLPKSGSWTVEVVRQIEEQITPPKPPRIAEPGKWGVVKASTKSSAMCWEWTHREGSWFTTSGLYREWHELIDPVLIRPGMDDEATS